MAMHLHRESASTLLSVPSARERLNIHGNIGFAGSLAGVLELFDNKEVNLIALLFARPGNADSIERLLSDPRRMLRTNFNREDGGNGYEGRLDAIGERIDAYLAINGYDTQRHVGAAALLDYLIGLHRTQGMLFGGEYCSAAIANQEYLVTVPHTLFPHTERKKYR